MFKSQFISFHSLHLGLVFIFTLLIAANSWADEFKQKKFEGVEIDDIPDQTYTADSICPTPDIDVPGSLKPFVKDTDYKVYCNDNVNAGEATLVVEGIGNYADTIKTIFIIKRAPLTVTAKNDTITYGDEPSNAGVEYNGFLGNDDESSLDDSLIFSYEYGQYGKPGDYAIIPSGPRSDKYEIEFVEGKLTVEPKRISIVWEDDTLFTYDGEAHAPKATAAGIVNNDSCGLTIAGAATNAGKYTAKVTELSNKNYKLPATGLEQAFEIKKAKSSIVKAPTAIENLVYNGKVQTLVTAGEAKNGTFVYKLASEEAYSESLPTAKDAGTYTIYFMVQGNENYNSTEAQKITATIEKVPGSSSSSIVVSSSSELPKSSSSSVVVSSSSEEVESSSSEATTPLEIARNASALKVAFAQNELMVTTAATSELKIFIFDMQGNLKKEYRGYSNGSHNLSLNQMNRGSYITRVISGNSVQTLRINVK
ncbi:MBG domain-containing protein [Fibrobacter sp.]|uniref:MBG domain-containing protein n=1 Tax=Fibrobacter sp. TaxID=35828 RepID=UPI0026186398|nr:MBG domain-containing protein [Fibrobacter sp.]MDD5943167.1 MBG domain-containing protein [Fibrobacter sp.]